MAKAWYEKSNFIKQLNDGGWYYSNHGAFLRVLTEDSAKNSVSCVCSVCGKTAKYKKSELVNGEVQLCNECNTKNLKIGNIYGGCRIVGFDNKKLAKGYGAFVKFECLGCKATHIHNLAMLSTDRKLNHCSCGYKPSEEEGSTAGEVAKVDDNNIITPKSKAIAKIVPKSYKYVQYGVDVESIQKNVGEFIYNGNKNVLDKKSGKEIVKGIFVCRECGYEMDITAKGWSKKDSGRSQISEMNNFTDKTLQAMYRVPFDILKKIQNVGEYYNNIYAGCGDLTLEVVNTLILINKLNSIGKGKAAENAYKKALDLLEKKFDKYDEFLSKNTRQDIKVNRDFFKKALTDKTLYKTLTENESGKIFLCSKHRKASDIMSNKNRFELKSKDDWKGTIVNNLKITNRVNVKNKVPYVSVECIVCKHKIDVQYRLDVLLEDQEVCCPYCANGLIEIDCPGDIRVIDGRSVKADSCANCTEKVRVSIRGLYSKRCADYILCRKDYRTKINTRLDMVTEKLKMDIAFDNMSKLVDSLVYKDNLYCKDGSVLKRYEQGYTAKSILGKDGKVKHNVRLNTYLCVKHTKLLTLTEEEAENYEHEFCYDPRMKGCNINHK